MRTVIEALGERAARHPERLALIVGDQRVSFGELWARVNAAACYISDCGVRPGHRVALAAPSSPVFVYGYFATHLVGAIAVPVNPNAPASRLNDLLRRTQPVLAFGMTDKIPAETPCPWKSIDLLATLPSSQCSFDAPDTESVADLIFTTGTTGQPKAVPLTHRNLATAATHIKAVIGVAEGDVDVIPIPLYHSFGLGSLRCFLATGATVVLVPGVRLPGEIFAAIERNSATGLIGVPAGFSILLRFGKHGLGKYSDRLRYIEIGSASIPIEQKRMLMTLLPRTSLFMHYGLTEAARSAFIEFHRDSSHLESVGRASPGVRVEIRDESGQPSSPGEPGALWVSGRHISPGYWDNPELNAKTFVDGWMCTGDVAHIDKNGYIHLHGRHDDMINAGGFKIAPDEVERVLAEHPAVSEAACVGVPDPKGISGQVLRAYLVVAEGQIQQPDAELSRWVARRLESYKVPVQYEWIPVLPRTESGKLVRTALRKPAPPKQ